MVFQTPVFTFGGGGSIPFIKVLQDCLPQTLLFVSGALLPENSIHCPNENLDLNYLEKFAQTLAGFLQDYSCVPRTN